MSTRKQRRGFDQPYQRSNDACKMPWGKAVPQGGSQIKLSGVTRTRQHFCGTHWMPHSAWTSVPASSKHLIYLISNLSLFALQYSSPGTAHGASSWLISVTTTPVTILWYLLLTKHPTEPCSHPCWFPYGMGAKTSPHVTKNYLRSNFNYVLFFLPYLHAVSFHDSYVKTYFYHVLYKTDLYKSVLETDQRVLGNLIMSPFQLPGNSEPHLHV